MSVYKVEQLPFVRHSGLSVIPACPESLLEKDSRRASLAGMTNTYSCRLSVIPACPESLLEKDSRLASLAGMTNTYSCRLSVIPACPESLLEKDSRLPNAFGIAGMTNNRQALRPKVGAFGKVHCNRSIIYHTLSQKSR